MQKVSTDLIINKEPQEIYFFIANLENLPFWSEIKAVEKVSGEGEIGSKYNITTPTLFGRKKTPIEVTVTHPHEHFAFKDSSTNYHNETGFRLEQIDGTTRVTAYQDVNIGGLISLVTLSFAAHRDTGNTLSKMLHKLKLTLETS